MIESIAAVPLLLLVFVRVLNDQRSPKCQCQPVLALFRVFWSTQRKIGDLRNNLCCSVTGNSAWRSHHTRTAKVCDNRLFGNYSAKSLELPLGGSLYTCRYSSGPLIPNSATATDWNIGINYHPCFFTFYLCDSYWLKINYYFSLYIFNIVATYVLISTVSLKLGWAVTSL